MIFPIRCLVSFLFLTLAACGGGDERGTPTQPTIYPPGNGAGGTVSGGPNGPVPVTHNQLVANFTTLLKKYDGNFVTLAKSSTDQYNHLVIKTFSHKETKYVGQDCSIPNSSCTDITTDIYHNVKYYALDITGWAVGTNADPNQFLEGNTSIEQVKLIGKESDKVFQGINSGRMFDKSSLRPKNLARIKALEERSSILLTADKLVERYGLSVDKAMDISQFSYRLRKAIPGTYTISDFDAFSTELIGSSISEFQTDIREYRLASLEERIKKAHALTGIGVEGLNAFIKDVLLTK